MSVPYPEIAARLFETSLMMDFRKADIIARTLGPRLLGVGWVETNVQSDVQREHENHRASGRMGVLGDPLAQRVLDEDALFRDGPVALIAIEGTLVHKGKWVGAHSGKTSYEGIYRQVQAARDDPSIRGVVLEVDSYGGEVAGAFDIAEAIHELAQIKPVIAILTDFAYSAGYLMASAARQIILPETGGAGSIGVVWMHVDYSKRLANDGISVNILQAGKKKTDGNPFEPLPDGVKAKFLVELEADRELFARTVAKYRGDRLPFSSVMASEAETLRGPDAVAAGLADAVARPSEAYQMFADEIAGLSPV